MQKGGGVMGKYTKLRGKVPAFQEESPYQEKINAAKQALIGTESGEGANVNKLAAIFSGIKQLKDSLEDKISEFNVQLEALSQLLCEALEDQQIEKITLASGATGFIQDTPYPVVKDKDAVLAWIKKEKMQALLGVNYQTLKGLTNERLVAGKPCIPGTEVFLKTQFRLRNGNNAEE